jgi:hypothetical protein
MMIPWRAEEESRRPTRISNVCECLAPVAFNPDVAFAVMIPVPGDPVGVSMGRFNIVSGDPDVAIAVPTVITVVPSPAGMLVGWRRDVLDGACGRANANNNLGLSDACN